MRPSDDDDDDDMDSYNERNNSSERLYSWQDATYSTSRSMASLWIINKAGGLIYNVDYTGGAAPAPPAPSSSGLATLSSNDYLILAGTLHGIHAITSRLSPRMAVQQQHPQGVQPQVQDTGLQQLQANGFDMNVMATATGQ